MRVLLVALVLNMVLASFGRTAYAHEHVYVPDDVVVGTKLPEGSVIHKYEDYARWFSAANLSEPDQHRLSWERTQGESPTILIMTNVERILGPAISFLLRITLQMKRCCMDMMGRVYNLRQIT